MEKRKHKVLSSKPQQALFNEDMKAFVAHLFQQNFSAMEERLQKQMGERFEKMKTELKGSHQNVSVEVEHGEPSMTKPSPTNPSMSKPSTTMPSPTNPSSTKPLPTKPSPRRSKRLDVNFGQEDDIDDVIGTQNNLEIIWSFRIE